MKILKDEEIEAVKTSKPCIYKARSSSEMDIRATRLSRERDVAIAQLAHIRNSEEFRKGIIRILNEFRQELQEPNAIITCDTLVVFNKATANQIQALLEEK